MKRVAERIVSAWVTVKSPRELKPGMVLRSPGRCACGADGETHFVTLIKKHRHRHPCGCGPRCRAPGWSIKGHCKANPNAGKPFCVKLVIARGALQRAVMQ